MMGEDIRVIPGDDMTRADMEPTVDMVADETQDLEEDQTPDQPDDMPEEMTEDMPEEMGGEDMPMDMPPATGCAPAARLDVTFDVDVAGPAPQYFSRPVFDGEGIWVLYLRREVAGAANADVYARRFGCDGQPLTAAIKLSDSTYRNDSPQGVWRAGALFVAWHGELSGDHSLFLHTLRADGSSVSAGAVDVTPQGEAGPISQLIWEPDIAAVSDTEAVIVASYASAKAGNAFQITAQRVQVDGTLLGDALDPQEEKDVDQTRPTITAAEDGSWHVGWTRYKPANATAGTPEEPHRVVYTRFAPGATTPDVPAAFPANPGSQLDNQLGAYSREATRDGRVYLAFQRDSTGQNEVLVRDGRLPVSGGPVTLDTANSVDLRPAVAASDTGGAVAWFRAAPSPTRNTIHVQPFTDVGGALTPGNRVEIPTTDPARPPYGPGLLHLTQGIYALTWTEGASDPRIKLRLWKP